MRVSKETVGCRVVSVGGVGGVKCFLVYPHEARILYLVALYTMNYLSSYRCWFLCYPKDIRHSTHMCEPRIPPPLASPVFKYEIESERQVCRSCTSCECISFLAEMFGYVLVSYGRERAKFWGDNSLECIELPKAYSISCSY